ncbi:hypothetical protein HMPREF1219_00135 [Corynebacterium pyruviciproducens ATCC BAA-1742]|uniref:Uncharacterized protein n=1 Tax=Corynebacterium pyruviciproducens ATCC BAA-1742 TaxID=1125779 RepID=S2Z923_9CORY|nr:hypothetical protein HMPREF1219_00135 [Corynebacterium pyruviciproducens ATCC BAA-1742]
MRIPPVEDQIFILLCVNNFALIGIIIMIAGLYA